MPDPQLTNAWLLLLEGILDWPFLLFVIVIFCSLCFRRQLGALLSRGDIAIDSGTGNIQLRELSEKFDQEVDPVREELAALQEAVKALAAVAARTVRSGRDRRYRSRRPGLSVMARFDYILLDPGPFAWPWAYTRSTGTRREPT